MTTNKPVTHVADITQLPRALHHLTAQKRWIVWRWELDKQNKWTKVPYRCDDPSVKARSNDPSSWGTYADALAAVHLTDGIGYMLKDGDVAAADLDHVRDAQTGALVSWAEELCVEADALGLYREVTVSGGGLRFIGLANGGGKLHRKFDRGGDTAIELYRGCSRYITVSGLQEGPCEDLGSIDGYLDTLLMRFEEMSAPVAPTAPTNVIDLNSVREPSGVIDLNLVGEQKGEDYYRDLIENGAPVGERSEKFQEVVWYLAARGWTIEEIVAELEKYPNGIGLKYAGRLSEEVTRSFDKWQGVRQTSALGVVGTTGGGATGTSAGAAGTGGCSCRRRRFYSAGAYQNHCRRAATCA
jgi:hypothetical protein